MQTFIHPTAIVEENAVIGEGTKIWAFAHVRTGAIIGSNCVIGEGVHIDTGVQIGNNVKIQNHSLIYHGCIIGDDVFIGPNVITTNDFYPSVHGDWKNSSRFRITSFHKGCSIGANSTIICGVRIGKDALVGAGSVVSRDVPDGMLAYGNPARVIKQRP
jgi:UDP-2-acetamido-3-amino-2,3-dideoxy-glucuronate N-acetyltransferase